MQFKDAIGFNQFNNLDFDYLIEIIIIFIRLKSDMDREEPSLLESSYIDKLNMSSNEFYQKKQNQKV